MQINTDANSINDFILPDSDFVKEIIRSSYTRSQCYHLQSPININKTLDILGEHAFKLNNKGHSNGSADLLDIEFLEEIAWHIGEHFINHIVFPKKKTDIKKTQIINLPNAKIRRANARP